ncbi:DNA adenine methylase [Patescibacteria group bacterium]
MRFIGNKENLVENIHRIMISRNIKGDSFFDVFSGTTSVAKYFKKLDYKVISSDLLYFSYVLQRAYIVNNSEPTFKKLLSVLKFNSHQLVATPLSTVIEYLNQIPPIEGFIYQNYTPKGTSKLKIPRKYFNDENGQIIDSIRQQIEQWKNKNLIDKNEYFILISCLIETVPFYANITGVYAAFQKQWDPRAVKKIKLRQITLIYNNKINKSFNTDSINLVNKVKADIFYLDPPYNQRQYAPNYHLLETIAKYDNPTIKGVTGLREYSKQKSKFCNANTALQELSRFAKTARCKYLMLSYNSEGIMPQKEIVLTLEKHGTVELVKFDYLRYKSNNNGDSKHKKHIKEQLYILTKSNNN